MLRVVAAPAAAPRYLRRSGMRPGADSRSLRNRRSQVRILSGALGESAPGGLSVRGGHPTRTGRAPRGSRNPLSINPNSARQSTRSGHDRFVALAVTRPVGAGMIAFLTSSRGASASRDARCSSQPGVSGLTRETLDLPRKQQQGRRDQTAVASTMRRGPAVSLTVPSPNPARLKSSLNWLGVRSLPPVTASMITSKV
jgi:hypothetical protein